MAFDTISTTDLNMASLSSNDSYACTDHIKRRTGVILPL